MKKTDSKRLRWVRRLFLALGWITFFVLAGYGLYNLVFWVEDKKINELYGEGGEWAPVVESYTQEDGKPAHAFTFFGKDGDSIFLPNICESKMIVGGMARFLVTDGYWFNYEPDDIERAELTLTPYLLAYGGSQIQLPPVELTVETPSSPVSFSSPTKQTVNVNTSSYPLAFTVVPGSSVYVNGENLSDQIGRSGELNVNVAVLPQGDNPVTVLVQTPYHKETRVDLNLYRAIMEIPLELSTSVVSESSYQYVAVTGKTDPAAQIIVDTPHLANTVKIDSEGNFSFVSTMEVVGDNTVRFRARMDGKTDSVISFTVYYLPTMSEYSKNAWRMDYELLQVNYEYWKGHVFLCEGTAVDVWIEDNVQYMLMNVSRSDVVKYVVLQNMSSIALPNAGRRYRGYADIQGTYFYKDAYYPFLVVRYMDEVN